MSTLGMARPWHSGFLNASITVTRYSHTKQTDGSYKNDGASTTIDGVPGRLEIGGSGEDWERMRRETAQVDGTVWMPQWMEGTKLTVRTDDLLTIDGVSYRIVGAGTPVAGDGRVLRFPIKQEVDT